MTVYNFIFSRKPNQVVKRHLIFWGIYCFYYWIQSVNPMVYSEFFEGSTYWFAFINSCCFIPMCVVSVYVFMYVALPLFLHTKRYLLFGIAFCLWFVFTLFVNYFASYLFLSNIHYSNYIVPNFDNTFSFGYINTVWAITIGLLALGIKLTKNWYLQQKENLEMVQRKTRLELDLQKAFIQPDFLLRSLDNISSTIDQSSDEPSQMILQLSDFLSYNLYHDDNQMTALETELEILRDYINLEQKNYHQFLQVTLQVAGNTERKFIPQLVILSLMQETIACMKAEKDRKHHVSCEVLIRNEQIAVNITFVFPEINLQFASWETIIRQAEHRLQSFFSRSQYEVSMRRNGEKINIRLEMPFQRSPRKDEDRPGQPLNSFYEPA